ncbi:peptidoglycan DD-metalloendopeptidase family protein [Salinarimonas soli]|uniref:Peptidoglycan DD-metalloendopeptidase family protein n=2 Tax=Salinarimonas soli TaxID=1638099 RepID=A0A5B2V6Z2_9HYPH|nr:peptidoglycan DD-metalloendopeptidase family protein [Salinarimonas soli]
MAASADARRALEAEIGELKTDRARLAAALVDTTGRVRSAEERAEALERRLATLTGSETAIRRSLEARRGVIVEVLAALQRMGRRPPPAVLARPEDILEAIRTSMLLGAVLPELRQEAETLAGDLAELVRLREAIARDRETLTREAANLARERQRLEALVAARQDRLVQAEQSAGSERDRAANLAAQAQTLKDLIDRMEREVAAAQRAAEEARRAAETQSKETRERFAALAFRDPARLAPKIPFQEARGALPTPVSGEMVRGFGAPDGVGGTARGISFSTRAGAIVSSPADGWVAFAGPFRSFGRLLIINAGGGYYLLLAGMERINVEVGQFVLAGEPVAVMGTETASAASAGTPGSGDPVLYVEFRKDGGSIDPAPWWHKSQSEKVRG